MSKFIKTYFGVFLAVLVALQGIVVQSNWGVKHADKITEGDNVAVAVSFLDDHSKKFPVIFEGERLIFPSPKNHTSWGDLFPFSVSNYLTHFENETKKQISLHHHVDLFFGIRELKFPSHFFW